MSHDHVELSWSPQPWLIGNVAKKIVAERIAQHAGDDREISKRLTNSQAMLRAKAQWENKRTRTVPTNTHDDERWKKKTCKFFDDNRDVERMGENEIT